MLLNQRELRALTFWRPWPHAILFGGKRIENRSWKPWPNVIGGYIALHAGMKYDGEAAFWMRNQRLYDPPGVQECPSGCIVGMARVTGYVEESDSPWFTGPCGWILENVVHLPSPIKAKGRQGLWLVDKETTRSVMESYRAITVAQAFS